MVMIDGKPAASRAAAAAYGAGTVLGRQPQIVFANGQAKLPLELTRSHDLVVALSIGLMPRTGGIPVGRLEDLIIGSTASLLATDALAPLHVA
jgi:hypothetical protein